MPDKQDIAEKIAVALWRKQYLSESYFVRHQIGVPRDAITTVAAIIREELSSSSKDRAEVEAKTNEELLNILRATCILACPGCAAQLYFDEKSGEHIVMTERELRTGYQNDYCKVVDARRWLARITAEHPIDGPGAEREVK